ncbi:MAG: hypothetical protein [aquatic viral metagenome]
MPNKIELPVNKVIDEVTKYPELIRVIKKNKKLLNGNKEGLEMVAIPKKIDRNTIIDNEMMEMLREAGVIKEEGKDYIVVDTRVLDKSTEAGQAFTKKIADKFGIDIEKLQKQMDTLMALLEGD